MIGLWGLHRKSCIGPGRVNLQSLLRHHTFDSNEGKLCRTCQKGQPCACCMQVTGHGRRRSDLSTSAANFSPVTRCRHRGKNREVRLSGARGWFWNARLSNGVRMRLLTGREPSGVTIAPVTPSPQAAAGRAPRQPTLLNLSCPLLHIRDPMILI